MADFALATQGRCGLWTIYIFGLRDFPTNERSITYAIVLCVSLLILVTALLVAAHWFRANVSRLAARVALYAKRLALSAALQHIRARYPQAWEFFARRFEPEEYLGLHLTVGLTISLAALSLFGTLTQDVLNHSALTQFDITILEWFHSHNTAIGIRSFEAISFLGSPFILNSLGIALAVYFIIRQAWIFLASWIAALIGAGILDWFLKEAVRRPRPAYAVAILHGHSFSFPSGHALASLLAYGMTAYFVIVLRVQEALSRTTVICLATILIFAIGVSRLYLGVHYFTDVIAGYAAGIVWLSTCVTGAEIARRQPAALSSEQST
jgi:membrane-associated phospholipid phosphatase